MKNYLFSERSCRFVANSGAGAIASKVSVVSTGTNSADFIRPNTAPVWMTTRTRVKRTAAWVSLMATTAPKIWRTIDLYPSTPRLGIANSHSVPISRGCVSTS